MTTYYCSRPLHLQPIASMQTYLRRIAEHIEMIPAVIPDGIYGEETTVAVQAFQDYFDLPVSGEIDHVTWDMIIYVDRLLTKKELLASRG